MYFRGINEKTKGFKDPIQILGNAIDILGCGCGFRFQYYVCHFFLVMIV